MDSLNLLDYTENLFSKTDFENTLVIACQHILGTNLLMFEKLFNHGLKPENTFLLGKCYSTNKETFFKFKKKGVNVHSGSFAYNSQLSFDEEFDKEVLKFLESIKKKVDFIKYQKIILVDDGGYLICRANSLLKHVKNIFAVEQTSSGYIKLKSLNLSFPVINIARSKAKLKYESPFVAETIINKMKIKLSEYKLSPKKVLIIGSGPVGTNIHKRLIKEYEVKQYDLNGKSDYKEISLNTILSEFDLIIGCTGSVSIKPEDFSYLKKGVILVSASSSDREFSASKLRKLSKPEIDCHKDIQLNGIILLNSGFPINFDGGEHSADPQKIQFTRSLIYTAICIANSNVYSKGMHNLDENLQEQIIKEFKRLR